MPSDFFYSPGPGGYSIHGIGLSPHRFSSSYSSYRRNFSINNAIVYGIISLNTGIYVYAQYCEAQAKQGFGQPWLKFWQKMTLNLHDVTQGGKWYQTITCVFTHVNFMHILGNMVSFYYIGGMLARTPGLTPMGFLTLVIGSGLSGSALSLWNRYQATKGQRDLRRGLGFSGAVMGVGAVAAFLYPKTRMLLWGVVPIPLWALMAGYAAIDGAFVNNPNSRVGHSGHLGGLAFGIVYYFAKLRGLNVFR